jgi:hypothetical protein
VLLSVRNEHSPISITLRESGLAQTLVAGVLQIRARHHMSAAGVHERDRASGADAFTLSSTGQNTNRVKLRAKDVPGTMLNIALINLANEDVGVRALAYNFLCALSVAFDFKLDAQLIPSDGLVIPANCVGFVRTVSEAIASNEPYLTLEFVEQCVMVRVTRDC